MEWFVTKKYFCTLGKGKIKSEDDSEIEITVK
jgi:hypothetical protein